MGNDRHDVPMHDMVAAQLVSHETRRFLSLTRQEFSKERYNQKLWIGSVKKAAYPSA